MPKTEWKREYLTKPRRVEAGRKAEKKAKKDKSE
jgi:hypothetical protein